MTYNAVVILKVTTRLSPRVPRVSAKSHYAVVPKSPKSQLSFRRLSMVTAWYVSEVKSEGAAASVETIEFGCESGSPI